MSDMVHLLHQGKIEQSAPPAEMYLHPRTKFAASFIGIYNSFTEVQFWEISGKKWKQIRAYFGRRQSGLPGNARKILRSGKVRNAI